MCPKTEKSIYTRKEGREKQGKAKSVIKRIKALELYVEANAFIFTVLIIQCLNFDRFIFECFDPFSSTYFFLFLFSKNNHTSCPQ